MRRKQILNPDTKKRMFDALYDDKGGVYIEVKLENRPRESIDLQVLLQEIEEGKTE